MIGHFDREPREKRGDIGGKIEAGVAGERRRGRLSKRNSSGEVLQKSLGAGRQAANLDIEAGARNKRILATPIGYRRKVDFAGVHRPDRNDGIVRRDDFDRGVQDEPRARQGVRVAANERGGRQRFCVGGVVRARSRGFEAGDIGEIRNVPRRFEVR